MATWPAGHRWEDYQVKILDVDRAWLGDLNSVHKLRGERMLYGQFGAKLTFSLEKDDPWAAVLKEDALHHVQVLRDDIAIFEGGQVKMSRADDGTEKKQWIDFAFIPLARRYLYWRRGMPIAPAVSLSNTDKVDDAMKWIVERTAGPTAPASATNAIARAYPGFSVAANKTEYPDNETLDATYKNIYEFLQQRGAQYLVDFDVYFDAVWDLIFQTWYPRRGLDRTEGNGVNTECIWTDENKAIAAQRYSYDASQMITLGHDRMMGNDEAASAALRAAWLVQEDLMDSGDLEELGTFLATHGLKKSWVLDGFTETEDNQWGTQWVAGDTITWRSHRLGYGPHNDIVCKVTFEVDEGGWEKLTPTLGDPEPKIIENLRGGGRWNERPDYSAPKLWYIKDEGSTPVPPDSVNAVRLYSTDGTIVITGSVANNRLDLTALLGGSCYWERDDVDSGAGSTTGLFTRTTGDPVMIGADSSANVANWIADTKLEVVGEVCVHRYVYALTTSLALFGYDDEENRVHIYDPNGATSVLDVYDGAAQNIYLNSDTTVASWLKGSWEVKTAAGATIWTVIPATPSAVLESSTTLGLGGYVYTFPTAGWATGEVLQGTVAGTAVTLAAVDPATFAGSIDHGGLAGLADDDHPQYMTPAEHTAIGDGAPHHAEIHVVNSTGPHAEAGLTIGHTLRVSGAAAFAFAELQHGDLGGVGAADHQALVTLGANLAANLLGLAGQALSLDNQAANLVFSGPAAGGAAAPSFRALVAADLPAASNIWTRVGANVYTTNANDCVVPNAGTGTLGLVGDPWDMLFAEDITLPDEGWIGIGAAAERIIFDAAGDISFMGCNVGFNTVPRHEVHINSGVFDMGLLIESTDPTARIGFKDGTTSSDFRVQIGAIGDALFLRANNAERVRVTNDLSILSAGDLRVYSDVLVTLKASIDGATGLIDTQQGYQYQTAAPAGHFLRGDGTQYIDDDLVGGVTGHITHAGVTTTIDSNAIVQDGEPGTMWAGMIWVDT